MRHVADPPIERYRTVRAVTRHEIDKIKASRFLATLGPARNREEALELLASVRAEHSSARHHGYAWRLGPGGEDALGSDAGEPSGSAGRPILQQLESAELTYAMLVVTRWFGGTQLGVGGLMRAYAFAASEVLARADTVTVEVTRRVRVEHPYTCSSAVQAVLAAHRLEPLAAEYGELVRFDLDVPVATYAAVTAALVERSAGRADVHAL